MDKGISIYGGYGCVGPLRNFMLKGGFPENTWGFPYKGDTGFDGISKLRNSGNPLFPLGSNVIGNTLGEPPLEVCGSR